MTGVDWTDVRAAFGGLDSDDRWWLSSMYGQVRVGGAVGRFTRAVERLMATEGDDEAWRDLGDALAGLGDDDLWDTQETHLLAHRDAVKHEADGLPEANSRWFRAVGQLAYAEGLRRRATWRAFEADVTSGRVTAWWSSGPGATDGVEPDVEPVDPDVEWLHPDEGTS